MKRKNFMWLFAALFVVGAIFFIKPQAVFAAEGDDSASSAPAAVTQTASVSQTSAAEISTQNQAVEQTDAGQTGSTQQAETVTTQSLDEMAATTERTAESSAFTTTESTSSTSTVASAQTATQQDAADEASTQNETVAQTNDQTMATSSTDAVQNQATESEATPAYSVKVNDGNSSCVAYGEGMTLTLGGYSGTGTVEFSYANADDLTNGNWHALSEDGHCRLAPGTYYLQYSLTEIVNGISSTVSVGGNKEFVLTVEKGTVGAPTGLTWNGSQMSWTAPAATTKGGTLDSGKITGYTLKVYKNGTLVFTTSTEAAHYDNFANNITGDSDKGNGRYTFTVQALTAENNAYYNQEGAVSTESGAYVVPLITVTGDAGIASITPGISFLLLPGNGDHNQAHITAVVKDGYQFASWSGTGVTFADANSADTTVTINADYNGDTSLTITATSKDNVAPSIISFEGQHPTALTAKASDDQTGIVKYVFTTKSNSADLTDDDWTTAENPAAGTKTFTYTLSAGGTYYFYAQDGNGNIAKSGPLDVTKITYKNYTKPKDTADGVEYFIGSGTYSLLKPSYNAYDFKGWYLNSDFSGDAQTTVTAHQDQGYIFYGKWTAQTISKSKLQLSNITKVYDGQGNSLAVNPTNTGSLSYQWFKGDKEIENATSKTLSVKNVADSGTYKVVVTLKDDEGNVVATAESNEVTVAISKRPVIIKAQDQTITYGDERVSSYLYIYEQVDDNKNSGLVKGDEKQITAGTLSCDYQKGNAAGKYDIVVSGFTSANYDIKMTPGTLTVSPKSADSVTAALAENTYTYTGSEIKPAVTIKDGETTLRAGTDYTVAYSDNTNVGNATATVTFKGNYTGTKELSFEITKANFESRVQMNNWTYGETASTPTVTANPGGGAVTYYYASADSDTYTTTRPTQAGNYKVKAVIAATDNYNDVKTKAQDFTIAKRQVTIKAADATFEYDGSAHSANTWSYVKGTFASGEGFFAVTEKGSATDVTGDAGVANVITYILTSSTDANNYDITAQAGKIVITPAKLTVPAQPEWSTEVPGTAAWIAVAKNNLTVAYKLTLYAYDGTTYTQIGDPVTVSGTSHDFSDAIRDYAAAAAKEGKAYRYAFTIQSISSGGMNRANYADSDVLNPIGNLLTAAVTLESNSNLSSLTIGGKAASTYILLQGEKAEIKASANEGWNFADPAFTATADISLTEGTPTDELIHDNFAAVHSTSAVIAMPADAAASAIGQTVSVNLEDDVPWITNFAAKNTTELKDVTFHFTMGDANGLAAWALTTSKDAPAADASVWHSISENPPTYEGSTSVSAAGTYYLYAKDRSGHIVTASTAEVSGGAPTYTQKGINVYSLTLKSGDGNGVNQTLYKIENTTVTLPSLTALGFSKTGYAFQNWYGATGIYQDQGGYAANANDTLTAHWTNEHFDVQVKYFYMGTDGTYSDTPDATVSYNVLYGTTVQSTDDQVKRDQIGFTRDDDASSAVTVTSADQSLNVYYKRNQYTITKTYMKPGETEMTETQTVYYGADVSGFLNDKPTAAGYTFVGWTFEGSGGQPATMPAYDVSATGTFEAQLATYHIVTYTQDLNADGTPADSYTEKSSRDVTTVNDAVITFGAADAAAIEGFTYARAAVTTGSGSAAKPADASTSVTAHAKTAKSETDKSSEVYINVFYTRNAYTLTQNVWKGEVGVSDHLLRTKSWTLYYGAPITAATYADDDLASIAPGSGYTLASYVGWSTNTAPTVMPAGNVTCTRQYVSNVEGQYQVDVYIEGDTANTYTKQTYNYTGNVGATVTIGKDSTDTINYNNLSSSIPYFKYLQYKTVTDQEIADGQVRGASGVTVLPTVTQATVTDTNGGAVPVVLRIYFERQPITATIHYYYNVNGTNVEMATVTKTQKWGTNSTFDYEALALFGTASGGKWKGTVDPNSLTYKVTIDSQNPDAYDFRNSGYVVSYTAAYDLNDTHYYNSYRYDSEASLTGDDIGAAKRIMGYANNVVNVYYTKPDPTKQYYLDVVYNSGAYPGLTHGENKDVPVTYTYGSTTYKLRYQNEVAFYKDAKYVPDTAHTNYPGLNNLNLNNGNSSATSGRYIYSTDASNVKAGYTRVEINGKNYFISGDYLYIPITDNNYFLNNLTSVVIGKSDSSTTVNEEELACTDITDFLEKYRDTYPSEARAEGAHVYYHAWGSGIVTGNDVLRVTFEDAQIVHLRYVVNGTSSYQQEYAQGDTTVTDFSSGNQNYPAKAGYDLVWYTDPACTDKATRLTMNTDHNVYGQYEKVDLTNTAYAYYELADDVTKNGTTYHYITEKDLDAFKDDAALVSSTDENGVTTWTYNGQIVMVQKTQTSKSFATVSMNADDYQKRDCDFTFDDANADNRLTGYAESEPLTLCAYFKRDQYNVTVDENKEHANAVTDEHRVGETIQLSTPSRNGYTFTGWKLTQVTGSGDQEWQTLKDTTSFTMPNTHIKAVAQWSPAAFTQNIVHYYQNPVTLTYNQAEVAAMIAAKTSTDVTINYNGTAYAGKLYANGGVTFEIGGTTYYIATPAKSSETGYSANSEDLSAIAVPVSATQDAVVKVTANKKDVDHYNFASAVYQYEDTLTQYGAEDEDAQYTNKYGMKLSYFYTLETGLSIGTQVTDDQGTANPSCTLTGAGENYHYGQSVSISAVPGAGYTFVGWYNVSDVLDSSGKLIQDYQSKTAVSKDPSFTQTVKGNANYVAVVSALNVAEPTLTVSGKTELTYGYEAGQGNSIAVQAAFADGTNTDDVNYIAGYQWYREVHGKRVAVDGATAAAFLIPEGLNAGTYTYTCDVIVARRDNGRTRTYTSGAQTLAIKPADMSVTVNAENPIITYDGQSHSAGVSVSKPADPELYKVYYSNEEITSVNLEQLIKDGKATTTVPAYTDVKIEKDASGKVTVGGAYTTYYYVKYGDANHNYQDASGVTTLTIVPKNVTLKAGSVVYHKTYDGVTTVRGKATDQNTDLGKLVHDTNIYTIVGMETSDADKGYVIDCSADFNSIHQSEANAITITKMKVINETNGVTNYNYVFADDYTITISGYIDRLPVTLNWSDTSFTYDGQSHQPTAVISSAIPDHDSGHLIVTVSGAQTNRGTYNASAAVSSTDAQTYLTDFSLSNGGQNFTITQRAITVAPDETTVTYNGSPQKPTAFSITYGSLPEGYTFTAEASASQKNAGTYSIAAANVRVKDVRGVDVTDNFAVTAGSSSFTIQPQTVTVSGITASDKNYDGNTKAALDISQAIFSGIVTGDTLSLDPTKVTGTFESANAGNSKNVAITIADGALSGTSAANYILAVSGNQSTATAAINKLVITVAPANQTIIYGEKPAFGATYAGFLTGETESVISGKIIYTVGKDAASARAYASTLSVGGYTIFVNIGGLNADNYSFKAGTGTLTIDPRPIAVTAASMANITKTYDGTTNAPVKEGDYIFTTVDGNSASGIVNSDTVNLTYTAAYDSKNAGAPAVHMTGLSIDNGNYELATNAFDIAGTINKAPLTVTAENKTITYGSAAPAYTAAYDGFVDGETSSVLSGTLTFACAYDTSDSTKRNVGPYTITPSGLTSDNYAIKFVNGTLKVDRKVITISANDRSGIYGNPYAPNFGYTYSGLAYGDVYDQVVTGTVTYTTKVQTTDVTENGVTTTVISSTAGNYTITPVVSGLSAQNYLFTAVDGTFTINRYPLKVTQLGVNGRVCDGTTNVYDSQYDYSNVKYDGLLAIDQQYFANNPNVQRIKPTGTYDTKDAGTNKTVTLSIKPGDYLKDRCYVVEDSTSQKTATSSITPRPVLITADSKTIRYGEEAPQLTVTYSQTKDASGNVVADSGLVAGETADEANVTLSTTYVKNDDVGGYEITVTDFTQTTGSANPNNYAPTYVKSTLTVKANQLAAPQPTWDSTVPGKVTWHAVSGIGKVAVQDYTVTLYKDGAAVTNSTRTVKAGYSLLEVNYSGLIHKTGAGAYTVKIKANASTENNADKKNVNDSEEGATSGLYAADVTFQFADDEITNAGKGDAIDAISIGGQPAYTMIAGETDVAINAALKNATGYTVQSVTSNKSVVTIANSTDTARTGASYASTVKMDAGLSAADPAVTVTLALSARPATLSVTVAPRPGDGQAQATYGYSEADAPSFTATANAGTGDNSGTDGYTYTYRWDYRIGSTDVHEGTASSNATWKLPTGLTANTSSTYYAVRCIVTATRKDNGQSTTTAESWNTANAPYVTNVTVNRASMTASVTLNGWTYGESRPAPGLTTSVTDNSQINDKQYRYEYIAQADVNDSTKWSTVMPTDAGDYYVRAVIPEDSNYNAFTTDKVAFTIAKNKLANPTNLAMGASGTAAYGTISWKPVSGVAENAGTQPQSEATVTYQVKLYKVDGNTETLVKTYDPTAGTSMNITSDLQSGGTYSFSVTALSSNTDNVLNSDEVISAAIPVGASITASGTGTLKDSAYSQKYDGTKAILTASYSGTGTPSAYQWYKNGIAIAGAASQDYTVKHVADSGNYTCVVTVGGQAVYTPILKVTISKRSVTLTSGTGAKVYDGTALINHDVTVSGDGFATGEGASYTFTGTQTNVGSSDNTFTYNLNEGTTSDNYVITTVAGTLTITARSLTDNPDLTVGEIADVIYNGSAHTPEPAVSDTGRKDSDKVVLVKGADYTYSYENNVNVGTATVTITGQGNYTGTIIRRFTIKPRYVSFSGNSHEITYDGTNHSYSDITEGGQNYEAKDVNSGLVSGHTSNVEYHVTGTEAGNHPGSITSSSDIVIKDANQVDVTKNYVVESKAGSLTINPSNEAWEISLTGNTYTYDGTAHCITNAPTTDPNANGAKTGTTTYIYSTERNGNYVSDLTSLTRTNAGTTTIYVKAANPNYSQTATTQVNLIIDKRAISFDGHSISDNIIYDGVEHGTTEIIIGGKDYAAKDDTNGLAEGHHSNVMYSLKGTDVGTYTGVITSGPVVITDENGQEVTANYAIQSRLGTMKIVATDAIWKIKLDGKTYTYDGTAHYITNAPTTNSGADGAKSGTTTYTYSTEENGNYVSDLASLTRTNAGTTTIYVKAANPNYSQTATTTATLTIKPKTVTITWTGDTFVYDGTAKSVVAEVSNKAKADDTFTLGYGGTREASAVGIYSARVISLGNDNYTLESATGKDHNWSISYLATDASANVTGTMGRRDWYVGRDTRLNAPEGYQISLGESDWAGFISYPDNGQYKDIQYKLKNTETGQITDFKTISFKVDQTQPTGTIRDGSKDITDTDSKIVYQYIYPDQVTVTIAAEDQKDLSGVDTIAYQVVAKGQTFDPNGTWQTYTNALNIAANQEAVVYAKITDKAGNVSIINTGGLVIYTNATDKDSMDYILTTAEDKKSGIAFNGNTVKTVKLGGTTLTEGKDYRVKDHKLIIDGAYLETLSAGDHSLTVSWNPLGEAGDAVGTQPKDSTITVHVLKHDGQVAITQDLSKTYDGGAVGHPIYTSKSTGTATYLYKKAADPDSAYSTAQPTDAGDYIVKVIVGTDSKYKEASGTRAFTIRKRPVSFTGVSHTITYNGKTNSYSDIVVGGDGLADGQTSNATYSVSGTDAGTYGGTIAKAEAIRIKAGEKDVTANYAITSVPGQLVINKSDANTWTISLGDSTYTYDGQAHAMSTTPSVSDANGTTDYQYSFNEADGYVKNLADLTKVEAGDYIIYVKAGNTNYTTTAKTTAHLIINPSNADWTIALDNDETTYDGKAHHHTKTAKIDSLAGTTVQYSFDKDSGYVSDLKNLKQTDAGVYTIYVKATNPNYATSEKLTTATLTIHKRPVTFTGVSDTVAYDGKDHTYGTFETKGIAAGQKSNVSYSLTGKDAGTYSGKITLAKDVKITDGAVDVTDNYDITTISGTLRIDKTDADWRVVLADDTVTYDGTPHNNTKTAVSHALSGKTSYWYSFSKDSGYVNDLRDLKQTDAGTYTIYVKATNPNYNKAAAAQAKLIINKRPITFTGESAAITYDGSLHTYSGVTTGGDGLASGHTSNLTYSLAGKDAGHYSGTLTQDIHITDRDNNDVTKNYDITAHNGTLIIAARPITENPDLTVGEIADVIYNGSAHTPEPAVSDTGRADRNDAVLVKGTDYTYSYSNNVDAGTATVTITGQGNYTGTITRTFTIGKRPVSFTGKSYDLTYDGRHHSYDGFTVDGLVDGQTSNVRYGVSGTDAGTYSGSITKPEAIRIKAGEKEVTANYAIMSAAGRLIIGRKDISKADVTLGDLVKFNNKALTQQIASVVIDGLTVTYTVDGDTASQPGVYTITLAGTGNFAGTCTKPWVLTADQNGQMGDVEGNVNVGVQLKNEAPKTDLVTSKASVIQLTADANEMSAVADGATLNIWLENTDITDTISDSSKKTFKKKAADLIIGAYVDISLYKQLFINYQGQAKTQLHNVAQPIKITMKLPKRLINNDANYRRSYILLRLHNGVVEIIPVDYNALEQTLTFSSDKFSEYAIVYADTYIGKSAADQDNRGHSSRMMSRTSIARGYRQNNLSAGSAAYVQTAAFRTNGNAHTAMSSKTVSPRTGDDQKTELWLILLLFSCLGLGTGMAVKRRRENA